WGPLEARLQEVELVLLGGLNEHVWPAPPRGDPFLNRIMKISLGMSLPERRIGQGAHDFQQLSAAKQVIYSRAARTGGAPSIPSRWLQRLGALAGKEKLAHMRAAGEEYLRLAWRIDMNGAVEKRSTRPEPRP